MTLYYSSEVSHCTRGRSIPAFTRWSRRWRLLGNRKIPDGACQVAQDFSRQHCPSQKTSVEQTPRPDIFRKSRKEHLEHVRGVLEALREAGLTGLVTSSSCTQKHQCWDLEQSYQWKGKEKNSQSPIFPSA